MCEFFITACGAAQALAPHMRTTCLSDGAPCSWHRRVRCPRPCSQHHPAADKSSSWRTVHLLGLLHHMVNDLRCSALPCGLAASGSPIILPALACRPPGGCRLATTWSQSSRAGTWCLHFGLRWVGRRPLADGQRPCTRASTLVVISPSPCGRLGSGDFRTPPLFAARVEAEPDVRWIPPGFMHDLRAQWGGDPGAV